MSTNVRRADAPVVVIGPMGAGKSSVGKRVAKALGVPFTDTDRAIVREHGPIPGIFADRGEPAFRALEAEAVRAALSTGGVVAVGGGAVTHADTRRALTGARIVLLTVSPEAVAERIAGSDRPLLANGGIDAWQTIMDERAATYAELAHVVVDTSRRPMSRVVDDVVTWVRSDAGTNAAPGSTTTSTTSTTSTEGAP
ncbi:shikimate kinase [Curtobacterium flaccumfaciens pv. flaccumfaciens]|uniref:shikimate kinase n=1 Tax=Curtobacterium poinsettiae TaxID=159612 RepID=UPI00217D2F72|nr:shikimate kinase [Curtobacterium flaccumfaciens]MCS6574975.1 shikimate kinase [Curtobacterium flaccumfaciens pv. flaccumfaciens]